MRSDCWEGNVNTKYFKRRQSLVIQLLAITDDMSSIDRWLKKKHVYLQETPLELIKTEAGYREILNFAVNYGCC